MANVEGGVRSTPVWASTASAVQNTQKESTTASPPVEAASVADSPKNSRVAEQQAENLALLSVADASLKELLNKSASSAQVVSRDLKINVDDDSGKYVISVLDPETDEVIRQFPPEGALNMIATISRIIEDSKGSLVNEKT